MEVFKIWNAFVLRAVLRQTLKFPSVVTGEQQIYLLFSILSQIECIFQNSVQLLPRQTVVSLLKITKFADLPT